MRNNAEIELPSSQGREVVVVTKGRRYGVTLSPDRHSDCGRGQKGSGRTRKRSVSVRRGRKSCLRPAGHISKELVGLDKGSSTLALCAERYKCSLRESVGIIYNHTTQPNPSSLSNPLQCLPTPESGIPTERLCCFSRR